MSIPIRRKGGCPVHTPHRAPDAGRPGRHARRSCDRSAARGKDHAGADHGRGRLLEQVFLVVTLQPWYTNAIKRVVKTPKLHFLDSGVLAVSRGLSFARVKADRSAFGALLETFVFAEVMKLLACSDLRLTPFHFRDQEGHEVDVVLERDDGVIAGIEVKAGATVTAGDFKGLRKLADAAGKRFVFGIVLYDGDTVVPFGERLAAAPISCLWH